MINAWWLVAAGWVCFLLMVCVRHLAYRQGIWDGAFNQFLPVVRREMMFYDPHRARKMLIEPDGREE